MHGRYCCGLPGMSVMRHAAGIACGGKKVSCVEAYDTLSGLKPLEELQKKIDADWKRYGD